MDNQKLFDQFMEAVWSGADEFFIYDKEEKKNRSYYFCQRHVGKAYYVYGDYNNYDEFFFARSDFKPSLVAVKTDNKLYLMENFKVAFLRKENIGKMQENVSFFSDIMEEYQKIVNEVLFPQFIKQMQLELEIKKDDQISDSVIREARNLALFHESKPYPIESEEMVYPDDALLVLSGLSSLKEIMNKRFHDKKDYYLSVTRNRILIKKALDNPDLIKDWEREMASCINALSEKTNCKTVSVTFDVDGIQESVKISPKHIQHALLTECTFLYWECIPESSGKELFERHPEWNYNLFCKNIAKISYRGKTVYQREKGEIQ